VLSLTSNLDAAKMALGPESLALTFLWLLAGVAMPISITSACWCYKKVVIFIYILTQRWWSQPMFFMKFDPWIPRMKVQLLYHQATPSYVSCLRGGEGWGRGENPGRKVFFMFTSAIWFDFFSFPSTYHSIYSNYLK
jgi:hypothetical protein